MCFQGGALKLSIHTPQLASLKHVGGKCNKQHSDRLENHCFSCPMQTWNFMSDNLSEFPQLVSTYMVSTLYWSVYGPQGHKLEEVRQYMCHPKKLFQINLAASKLLYYLFGHLVRTLSGVVYGIRCKQFVPGDAYPVTPKKYDVSGC